MHEQKVVGESAPAPVTSGSRLLRGGLRRHVGLQIGLDAACLVTGFGAAYLARFSASPLTNGEFWMITTVAVCLLYFVGTAGHLYLGRYRFGGFDEVLALVCAVASTTVGAVVVDVALGRSERMPAEILPLAGAAGLVLMFGVRYLWRLAGERRRRRQRAGSEPIIVFGAGEGADRVLASMSGSPDSPYTPVALLDDDPGTWNLALGGVRVRGGRGAIAAVARQTGARTLLVAIPSADAALLREITTVAEGAGLAVKVLPRVADLIDGRVGVHDIRDLDITDLLGRCQIQTDVASVAGYVTGRRVLVTGAGGSIGSQLCRQLYPYRPQELVMLDRDESALRAVQISIHGQAAADDETVVLCDIRDVEAVNAVFARYRPQVVFHAAALKHLPLLERFPGESVKTNVWGTMTVLDAAVSVGVERFVNISTDKAANPTSVLGYSKRITERLTAGVSADVRTGVFVSVRFGNVLGSQGSVLRVFASQLAAGGPLTVTHPDVTRYFMTVEEAVELVVQAGALGGNGDVLVLDMGRPVRIADVARRLAGRGPRPVEVVYTGLGPGEKLHEDLFDDNERDIRHHHPLISYVSAPAIDRQQVLALAPWGDPGALRTTLRQLARPHPALPHPAEPHPLETRQRETRPRAAETPSVVGNDR
ncbi:MULTISPECIES: nucleoside-diphosphate sugar epimerase/dehydratase [Protofrankia]|uniref:Polysaccharide biosynthesis protein CapD n=1 Tax=Candidatus Protofrankia datiscae TaxID=2716812 RepID=F8AV82_9ACTN|nr:MULTISPECIES: nucleoside-diphosphate sugar epimerase/dehydratase [Protofrankia]AEH10843.1 polysaccharide biosynthesis protein CapD [Candidatus Protofrankia datiscae]